MKRRVSHLADCAIHYVAIPTPKWKPEDYSCPYCRNKKLELRLAAVEALPDRWISEKVANPSDTGIVRNRWIVRCADDLKAALKGKP